MKRKFLVTCDPGLEDIVKMEIEENIENAKIYEFPNLRGRLLIEVKDSYFKNLFTLHSIYHIIEILEEFNLNKLNLEEIRKIVENIEIEEMKEIKTFRVTSIRLGNHTFTSLDVERIVGEVLVKKYNKKVSLKNFDLEIRADVINDYFFIGIQMTKDSLHKRFKKVFEHKASIKPTIAYGMIRLSGLKDKENFLDPMCGSGTIALETASLFKNKVKIYASDIDEICIKGAIENAKINNLENFIEFRVADAQKLDKYYSDIDKIVTNPPYGVRLKENLNLKELYKNFLISANKVLNEGGKIVMITMKFYLLEKIIKEIKFFNISHKRVVESGGIFPRIYVLEKI